MLQATADHEHLVCFVTGHGERGWPTRAPPGWRCSLRRLGPNYRTEPIRLLEDDVPSDAPRWSSPGPRRRLPRRRSSRLDAYYSAHGRMAVLLEPDPAPSLPSGCALAESSPAAGAIVDTSGAGQSVGGGPRTPLGAQVSRSSGHPRLRDRDDVRRRGSAAGDRAVRTSAGGRSHWPRPARAASRRRAAIRRRRSTGEGLAGTVHARRRGRDRRRRAARRGDPARGVRRRGLHLERASCAGRAIATSSCGRWPG